MLATLGRRRKVSLRQVSPISVLRKTPSLAATQISPPASTATALMVDSFRKGFAGSQFSPPLAETATALRDATTAILSAVATPITLSMPNRSSLRQVFPASALIMKLAPEAANQRFDVTSSAVMRDRISTGGRRGRIFF